MDNSFKGRINFAATVISSGRNTTRNFDNCFENFDGDEVCTVLYRRTQRRPNTKLAQNLFHYVNKSSVLKAAARLADISDADMPSHARHTRERRKTGGAA